MMRATYALTRSTLVKSPDSRPLIKSSVVASIKLGNGVPWMAVLFEQGRATWAVVQMFTHVEVNSTHTMIVNEVEKTMASDEHKTRRSKTDETQNTTT